MFHAYDYGANVEIKVNSWLQRPDDDLATNSDDSDSDSGADEPDNGSSIGAFTELTAVPPLILAPGTLGRIGQLATDDNVENTARW